MNTKLSRHAAAGPVGVTRSARRASSAGSVPTMIDVAQAAGVSTATVSRVLNGTGVVSRKMRSRVLATIDELGFSLNPMAQGLRKGQSNTVALLVSDIEQAHFSAMTKQVQSALESLGLDLMLFNVEHSAHRLEGFLNRVLTLRLKGVIVALSDKLGKSVVATLKQLAEHGVTVVSIGQNLSVDKIASVVQTEREATAASVLYLINQGRRHIAYLGRIKGSAIGTERYEGYKEALSKAGLFEPSLTWDVAYRFSAGRLAIEQACDTGQVFDGVQAGSDEMAIGAITALMDRNIRVPADVAVIGFGDIEMGAHVRPALTTISSHPEDIGIHVGKLFTSGLNAAGSLSLIQRSLIHRESA
ncbi:LacI family transcriptional regulator [Parapusillimonas sp. SGNA-6]|nr:LacI family transcriptional regulator [Parapusillimonas sp. SGNA-6]